MTLRCIKATCHRVVEIAVYAKKVCFYEGLKKNASFEVCSPVYSKKKRKAAVESELPIYMMQVTQRYRRTVDIRVFEER